MEKYANLGDKQKYEIVSAELKEVNALIKGHEKLLIAIRKF